MSDIKVTYGWTISENGAPYLRLVAETAGVLSSYDSAAPCVLVWLKDFNALSTDAMRWRSHLIIAAKERRLAEISANFEEIRRGVESLSPSVGENASETIAGFPVVADPSVPPGTVEARIGADVAGRVTGLDAPAPSLAERFPVGRRVKILSHVGDARGLIREVNNDFVRVERGNGGMYWFRPDEIELFPEAPAPAPWVPKAGERVRIKPSIPTDFGVVQSIDAHDGTALVFVDGCTRWYKITELEPAPTDPAPVEPSKAAFAAWKHRVPVVGERVRALTPNRYGQLGTVNAPAKFDNDADRHGQVVIVSAKMDTGEVVVNGIQWWEPAEPIDGVSLVTDTAMDEMRRKLADRENTIERLWFSLPPEYSRGGEIVSRVCQVVAKLATVEKERDEARAKLSLAQVAESFLDSRMTRIRTTLDRVFPAIEEAAQGPRVLEPWEQIERIAKERDEARAEREKYRSAASVLCGAHIGVPQNRCPVCDRDAFAKRATAEVEALGAKVIALDVLGKAYRHADEAGRLDREVREFRRRIFGERYVYWLDNSKETLGTIEASGKAFEVLCCQRAAEEAEIATEWEFPARAAMFPTEGK